MWVVQESWKASPTTRRQRLANNPQIFGIVRVKDRLVEFDFVEDLDTYVLPKESFLEIDKDWGNIDVWRTIKLYSPNYTTGYFLNAVDLEKSYDGIEARPENEQIYLMLFGRTLFMSLVITFSCILLGYPVAWILANLPARTANLLMILVLLPFWTSLLVLTSAWKVLLQQQGVINDVLVWLGMVADDSRLVMINNQTGTIIAMTHILLPFMILPLFSVMKTISPPGWMRRVRTNWSMYSVSTVARSTNPDPGAVSRKMAMTKWGKSR